MLFHCAAGIIPEKALRIAWIAKNYKIISIKNKKIRWIWILKFKKRKLIFKTPKSRSDCWKRIPSREKLIFWNLKSVTEH